MNKEQMIAALNDLKYKIDLGKLDNFNIDERNAELEEISKNLTDIEKEIGNLEGKIGDDSNYKEGSPFDLAQKEQQRLERVLFDAEIILNNNKSNISVYNSLLKNENAYLEEQRNKAEVTNDEIINIGRKLRALSEEDIDKQNEYNNELNAKRNELNNINTDIDKSTEKARDLENKLNNENELTERLTNDVQEATDNLDSVNNNMNGLSLVNNDDKNYDIESLDKLKKVQKSQQDREKVLSTTYSNSIDGIIANLSNDRINVPQAGEQLQELINNIPESYFITTEKERENELKENQLNQGIYKEQIEELEGKLNNKEKYFYLSNFRIEQMEDELARWDSKIVEYDRQLHDPIARIQQIDYELNGLENIIKKHNLEIENAKKENDEYNTRYYETLKNEANEKINVLKDEKLGLDNDSLKNLRDLRNRSSKIAESLRTKINNKETLLDNSRIRLAEEKLRSSVAALNALKQRELFLNESAKEMLVNAAENAKTPTGIENNEELSNNDHTLNTNMVDTPLVDKINQTLKDEGLGVQTHETPQPTVDLTKKEEEPVNQEITENNNDEITGNNNDEINDEKDTSKNEEDVQEIEEDEPTKEEGRFKAAYRNATDKLKEKARAMKHSPKFAKWAKRLTAFALVGLTVFGVGKVFTKKQMDDVQNPAITDQIDNGDKSIEEILKDDDDEKEEENEEEKDEENKDNELDNNENTNDTAKVNNYSNNSSSHNNGSSNNNSSSHNNSSSNNNSSNNNSTSQYPSTNTHDNSDQISVPETDEEKDEDKDKNEINDTEQPVEDKVPDAVITDTDKEEEKDEENKVTIEDATEKDEENNVTIEDENKENTNDEEKNDENVYDNSDKVETPVVNDNSNITIEDAPSNENTSSNENVYDNSNNVTVPDSSVTETPSNDKIELFDGETYTNGDSVHENNTGSTENITIENTSYQPNGIEELSKDQLEKLRSEYINNLQENEFVEEHSITL